MHWHQHQCHMMSTSSMGPLCSLHHDHKMKCNITFSSCDIIGTSMASHDACGIVNCTITFLVSIQSKWGAIWQFWLCDVIGTASVSNEANYITNCIIAFFRSKQSNEIIHDPLGHVIPLVLASSDADGVTNKSLHSLVHQVHNEGQHNFFVMWCLCMCITWHQ